MPQQVQGTEFTVYASTPSTKTVNDGYNTNWEANDQIKLSYKSGYGYTNIQGAFTTVEADGTFTGVLTDEELDGIKKSATNDWVAIYPFTSGNNSNIAFPVSTVQNSLNNTAHLAGENLPLYGEAKDVPADQIPNFTMSNMASVIAVEITNNREDGENLVIETVAFSAGNEPIVGSFFVSGDNLVPATKTGVVALTTVENAAPLAVGEKGTVYVVVKPFTVKPAEGETEATITVWVNNTPKEIKIEGELAFSASKIKTTKFEYIGDNQELYIKADAEAYMEIERIVPSLNNVNIEAWAKALYEKNNTKAIIEEAITYITLKNYRGAYDVLGGVPGFVRETKTLKATGTHIQKVDYTGASYLVSMLEGIESISDIPSLLAYMTEFEEIYKASGIKGKLDERLGSIADNFDAYIDAFVDSSVSQKPEDDLNEAEAFAAYKAKIKEQLESSITGWDILLSTIKKTQEGVKMFGKWIVEPNPSFMKDEVASLEAYMVAAKGLLNELENLSTKEAVETKIKAIAPIKIELESIGFSREIKPETWLTGAESAYADKINEQIANNETVINGLKAGLRTAIEEIQGQSLVESLEKAVNEPESTTAMVLNYLFAQESFMETVKTSLREIVTEIEAASREDITNNNNSLKEQAINTAVTNAIIYARVAADKSVDANLGALNESNRVNLYNGPWGIFQAVLQWEHCKPAFEKLQIVDVYDALVKLSAVVEEMIKFTPYEEGYTIKEFEDYQKDVDYWVLTPSELYN